FTSLPEPLADLLRRQWARFVDAGGALPPALAATLPRVWAGSDYVSERMIRTPMLAEWLVHSGNLAQRLDAGSLREEVAAALRDVADEAALFAALRQLRHRHMVRIIWRDLGGQGDYHSTVADLSLLADTLIDAALEKLYTAACEREGTPLSPGGQPVRMVVFAMGKLGARELNLSSDIDLIFAYEHEGEIEGHRREMSYHQFFVRLGQQLIKALDQNTADGFVFRVDMRLRPWGGAGALAVGFDAMEGYYEEQGREWERYALIKIRPVAGGLAPGEGMGNGRTPSVSRRYEGFGPLH